MAKILTTLILGLFIGSISFIGDQLFEKFFLKKLTIFLQEEVAKEIKKPWGDPNPFKDWKYSWEKIDRNK